MIVLLNDKALWASCRFNGLVESIEKAAGIKFCKPYFNRENSLSYRGKSIMHVIDHVKQKYKIKKC